MKSPSVSEKVKIEPATTAGKASGRITRRKVVERLGALVLGRVQHRVRDALEPRVDRDDHVRQPEVAHDEPHGDVAEARPAEPRMGRAPS